MTTKVNNSINPFYFLTNVTSINVESFIQSKCQDSLKKINRPLYKNHFVFVPSVYIGNGKKIKNPLTDKNIVGDIVFGIQVETQ